MIKTTKTMKMTTMTKTTVGKDVFVMCFQLKWVCWFQIWNQNWSIAYILEVMCLKVLWQMIAGSTVDAIDQSWFPCFPSQMNKHYNLFKGYDVFLYMKSSVLIKNSTWTSSTYTDCRLMIYWFSLNHSLTSNICISSHFFTLNVPNEIWNCLS